MARTVLLTASGVLAGLVIGILGPVTFVAGCVWDDRTDWSLLTKNSALPYWISAAVAGAVNGGIGVLSGRRAASPRPWPVIWVPLLLLLWPLAEYVRSPADPKSAGLALFVAGFLMLFVWVAGRVGQEIGARTKPA